MKKASSLSLHLDSAPVLVFVIMYARDSFVHQRTVGVTEVFLGTLLKIQTRCLGTGAI
jgi:hypothetical protein